MQSEKNIASQVFSIFFLIQVILCPSQGDSGGPLWVREDEGGDLPTAYLVQQVFLLSFMSQSFLLFFSCSDFFCNFPRIYPI